MEFSIANQLRYQSNIMEFPVAQEFNIDNRINNAQELQSVSDTLAMILEKVTSNTQDTSALSNLRDNNDNEIKLGCFIGNAILHPVNPTITSYHNKLLKSIDQSNNVAGRSRLEPDLNQSSSSHLEAPDYKGGRVLAIPMDVPKPSNLNLSEKQTQLEESQCRSSTIFSKDEIILNEAETEEEMETLKKKKFWIKQYVLRHKSNLKAQTDSDQGHSCPACYERFCLASGLRAHLHRKIIKIIINCKHCNGKRKVFYNGCALKKHFESHGISDPSEENLLNVHQICFEELPLTVPVFLTESNCRHSDTDPFNSKNSAKEIKKKSSLELRQNSGEVSCHQENRADVTETPPDLPVLATANCMKDLNEDITESEALLWCHGCDIRFANGQLFYDHLKDQERSTAGSFVRVCDASECSFPAMSLCSMTFHTRLCHQELKPFLCSECGWNKEMNEPNSNWQLLCDHLSGTCFQSSKVAKYQCKVISHPGYDVTSCNFQCKSFKKLVSHYGSAHVNIVYTCNLCNEEFSNKYFWFKHLFKSHKDNKANFIEADACLSSHLKCECCSEILEENVSSFKTDLQNHLLSKLNQHCDSRIVYKCSACYHLFDTCDELKRHRKEDCFGQSNGTESCLISSSESEEEEELEIEQDETKSKEQMSLDNRNRIHNKYPSTSWVTWNHQKGRRQLDSDKSGTKPERIQPCRSSVANELVLRSWNSLQDRLQKPRFRSARNLSIIPPIKGLDDLLIECQHCHKKFTSRDISKHEKRCVKYLKRRCMTCFMSCHGKAKLLEHGGRHLGEGRNICIYCRNEPLKEKEEIESHLRTFHCDKVEVFPHVCSLCKEVLLDRSKLELHAMEHHKTAKNASLTLTLQHATNESASNKYICAQCGMDFTSVRKLLDHKKIIHTARSNGANYASTHEEVSKPTQIRETKKRPKPVTKYKCKTCLNEYESASGLRKHILSMHPETDLLAKPVRKTKIRNLEVHDLKRMKMETTDCTSKAEKKRLYTKNTNCSNNSKKTQTPVGPKVLHDSKNEMKEALSIEQVRGVVWQSIARLSNANFKCVKCSEVLFTEDSFYSHIRTEHVWKEMEVLRCKAHTDVDFDSFWCFECGAEFMTRQTLKKHVYLQHESSILHQETSSHIKNVDEYLDMIGYGNWKLPLKTNQCEVCFVVCDSTLAYESHFRSHGLAYLKMLQNKKSSAKSEQPERCEL